MTAQELIDKVVQKRHRPFASVVVLPAKSMGAVFKVKPDDLVPEDGEANCILIRVDDVA